MFLTNVTSFSARFSQRYSIVNERIQLRVDPLQRRRQLRRQGGGTLFKGCEGWAKDSRFQAGHQPRHFPAVGSEKVAMRSRWPEDQTLQPQASPIIRHLRRRVRGGIGSQQVGHVTTQVAMAEALDQCVNKLNATHKAITRGSPNFNPGAL